MTRAIPHRVPRKSKQVSTKRSSLNARLNWQEFNLLENLLVHCIVKGACAPPESGVEFRINSPSSNDLICILFQVDRKGNDPLVKEGIKPDYMTLHISAGACICTIIEMKGRGEDDIEHGVNQILRFRDILRGELAERLPSNLRKKITFQGIILSPPNSNVPLPKIKREEAKGFIILPLQYHHKAELYRYVSTAHKKIEGRYMHDPMPHSPGHGFLEGVLTEKALGRRIKDQFFSEHYTKEKIYLNYELSNAAYAAFVFDKKAARIGVKEKGNSYHEKIRINTVRLGVRNINLIKISDK